MSIVAPETIEVIAQSLGIPNLSSDVAAALAPDVDYRLRDILQEAIKCMRHSKRTILTAADVDSALVLRNVEPVYGFTSGDPLRFRRAAGHKDLFYIDDREVDFKEVIEAPLPKAPLDTTVVAHWLAIEGVQPAIPENPSLDAISAPPEIRRSEHSKDDNLPVDIKLPVKHVLSKELQMYFDKIAELTVSKSDSVLFKEALLSLANDSGLHPLVPYFSYFIADEVTRSLSDLPVLFALMRVLQSLFQNPHIHIEPYLHQLMPSMITCLVAKKIGNKLMDDHWALRDFSATLVASVCRRFGHVYHNLQSRLTKTLVHAFLDPAKAMTQHYGAIQGLSALGPSAVRLLILPNLQSYMQLLEPEMQLEKQKNEMKRKEAWRVYGALLLAAGGCLYDRLKLFPNLLTPSSRPLLKSSSRITTSNPNKRKGGTDNCTQQPPSKKPEMDGVVAPQSASAMAMKTNAVQGAIDGFPMGLPNNATASLSSGAAADGFPMSVPGNSGPSVPPSARQSSNDISSNSNMARRDTNNSNSNHSQRASAVLRQAWKEDLDAGLLLSSLFELFGEGVLSFMQPPEMNLFI